MVRKSKMTKRKFRKVSQKSSWSTFTSIWRGKSRPNTPWVVNTNLSPRKKRKEPRVLQKRHY